MQIHFDRVVVELDGSPAGGDTPLTVGSMCLQALVAAIRDETPPPPAEVERRYRLALRIQRGGEQDLSPEDCTLLRDRICRVYGVWAAGQACEALGGVCPTS